MNGTKKFVKINESRGYGSSVFTVLKSKGNTLTLKSLSGEVFDIYEAHTYRDSEVRRLDAHSQINNSQIGMKAQIARSQGLRR